MTDVFLDTDVILDLFIDREPHHAVALRFFSYLQRNASSIHACTSPVVIANVAYLLGRAKNEAYAVAKIRRLRKRIRILPMGQEDVDHATARPGDDFEDSLQYHCAIANDVKFIITRNRDDFLTEGVQVVDPAEFMLIDSAGRRPSPPTA